MPSRCECNWCRRPKLLAYYIEKCSSYDLQVIIHWNIFTCCEVIIDILFCVIAPFKNVLICPLTLAVLCLDVCKEGGNEHGKELCGIFILCFFSHDLHLVSTKLLMLLVWDWEPSWVPGSWWNLSTPGNCQCVVSFFQCLFFPICVFVWICFSYAEQMFYHEYLLLIWKATGVSHLQHILQDCRKTDLRYSVCE